MVTRARRRRSIGSRQGCSADHPKRRKPAGGLIGEGGVRVHLMEVRHPPREDCAGVILTAQRGLALEFARKWRWKVSQSRSA